jgi:type III pantothenate kinase
MILCVDAGNSFVKYALVSASRCVAIGRQPTGDASAWRGPKANSRHRAQIRAVDGVMVSSVVPSLNRPLKAQLERWTGQNVVFAGPRLTLPFRLDVERPRRLGIDRICASAGAVRRGARSVIVVDIGSAITVDLVTRGAYRGGLIMAGPGLGLEALSRFAEQLPEIDPARLGSDSGGFDTTRRAMLTGASIGGAGAVREAVRYVERRLKRPARKVVTGGGAQAIIDRLPRSWRHDPDLVLKGLHHVWTLNRSSLG